MQERTILILGAQGRLGTAAVQAFAQAGWRVRAASRRPHGGWPAGVEALAFDALDSVALCRAAQGAGVILNALNPPYTEWDRLARPLAAAALAAARASGALLMFPGNVYNFGRALPARLAPDTPQVADTGKARVRIDIERQLAQAAGVDSVVLRAGDFFGGRGRGSWFDLVISASLAKGKLVYPGPAGVAHAWAYLPDLAATFVLLAERRARLRGAHCFHFAGHNLTSAQLHAEAARLVGRPLRLSGLAWPPIRLLAWFSPMMRAIVEMRYLWQRPHSLDDGTLRALLGAPPHTPLAQALAGALAALDLLPDGSGGRMGQQLGDGAGQGQA